jgi:hypothetical protein
MLRGDHTVTGVVIQQLPPGADDGRYYGTDPVANVSLSGEVLFRSSWTRKLMPVSILKGRLAGVLSDDDQKRVAQDKE